MPDCDDWSGRRVALNYSMVLVGGGLDDGNDAVWNRVIELGGGVGGAKFGVISSASENPCCDEDSSWVYYRDQLTRYGAAEVYYIPVTMDTKGNNSDPAVVAKVRTLTGFFFGGGDQSRIIYSFYNDDERMPSPVLTAIKETVLSVGGVVAGTSAGTDCQTSKVMISGGESYDSLRDGTSVFWRSVHPYDAKILAAFGSGGLGFFTFGLLDTHFANRGRHGRLVELVVDTLPLPMGHSRAFGIDENTALVVTGPWDHRIGTVIGEGGVNVFDVSAATVMLKDKYNVWHARISEGDVIDLDSFRVSFAPYKNLMSKNEIDVEPYSSRDIFRVGTFEVDKMAQSLFRSTSRSCSGTTFQSSPKFRVKMSKDWSSEAGVYNSALGAEGIDPSTGIYSFSYVGVRLDFVLEPSE